MMALVNYDNSDSSDYEDEDQSVQSSSNSIESNECDSVQGQHSQNLVVSGTKNDLDSTSSAIFKSLPQPYKEKIEEEEIDDEFLKKKEPRVKPKAKITVPSLSDFKDVEDMVHSKPKLGSGKKSGLLSILPQPKNTVTASVMSKTMIPHVLTQKTNIISTKEKISIKPTPNVNNTTTNKLNVDYSDEDEDDDVQNDFFAINKPEVVENEIMIDNEINIQVNNLETPGVQRVPHNINMYLKDDSVASTHMEMLPSVSVTDVQTDDFNKNCDVESTSTIGDMELDEEAIRQLVGARGRRKKEDIQIVDVNQQEVLQNAREMFMKGLLEDTTKRVSSSKRKGNEPTSQQKRKHQITYLAHQAKANEIELQNQWANNRVSRRQTQSKYGF